jgi:hypothetical protein
MAYDAARNADRISTVAQVQTFRRDERLIVLMGGASLGILAGVGSALALGRTGWWLLAILAVPLFAVALYFAVATFRDAVERRAIGCAVAASLVAASLLAWPVMALLYPMSAPQFWIAPAATLGSMVLLASCWSGAQRAVYRLSGEAASLCAIACYLGLNVMMG